MLVVMNLFLYFQCPNASGIVHRISSNCQTSNSSFFQDNLSRRAQIKESILKILVYSGIFLLSRTNQHYILELSTQCSSANQQKYCVWTCTIFYVVLVSVRAYHRLCVYDFMYMTIWE